MQAGLLVVDLTVMMRNIADFELKVKLLFREAWFQNALLYLEGWDLLFSGSPGTGKTMAAQVIAGELQLDLYQIDLSQVVSKYIGETEKNLNRVFTAAAFLAAAQGGMVMRRHLLQGIRREYQKMGKVLMEEEFGE